MSDIIRAEIHQLLTLAGITYAATYQGLQRCALDGDTDMDRWACAFTNAARPREPEEFEFYTGLGLRAKPTPIAERQAKYEFPGLTQNDIARHTQYGKRYRAHLETLRKPQAPHAANVLHSLILDSSAASQSFGSWCSDFGYDTDSRKAFNTYEACQRNADQLRRIIPADLFEHLSTLLQDY